MTLPIERELLFDEAKQLATRPEADCSQQRADDLVGKIADFINRGEFGNAINQLNILKDNNNAIYSEILPSSKDPESPIYLRDARKQASTLKPGGRTDYQSWTIIGLNYLQTALELVAKEPGYEADQAYIKAVAEKFFTRMQNSEDPEVDMCLMVNSIVVPFVKDRLNLNTDNAKKQLEDARDFSNFLQPTPTVATITRIDTKDCGIEAYPEHMDRMQIEVPLTGGMSDKLNNQYQQLADPNTADSELNKIKWYTAQPKHVRVLIRKHASDVLKGRIIPTQLRKFLPGVRNAFEERSYDVTDPKNCQQYYQGYRAASPAHLLKGGKKINAEATLQSLGQLQRLTGAHTVINHTLISPMNPIGEEKNLNNQVETATNAANAITGADFHQTNTPLNAWRRLSGGFNSEGLETLLVQARALSANWKQHEHSNPNFNHVKLLDLVVTNTEAALKRSSLGQIDSENENLHLTSMAKNMANLISICQADRTVAVQTTAVISGCQSDKDRGALASSEAGVDATLLRLTDIVESEVSSWKRLRANIERSSANGRHYQKQAGLSGGTLGGDAIKSDSKGAIPKRMKFLQNILSSKSASYNKTLPPDPREIFPGLSRLKIVLCFLGSFLYYPAMTLLNANKMHTQAANLSKPEYPALPRKRSNAPRVHESTTSMALALRNAHAKEGLLKAAEGKPEAKSSTAIKGKQTEKAPIPPSKRESMDTNSSDYRNTNHDSTPPKL